MVTIQEAFALVMKGEFEEAQSMNEEAFNKILKKNQEKLEEFDDDYIYRISIAEAMVAFYGQTNNYRCFRDGSDVDPDKLIIECNCDYSS